jgi:hypothetical protein
VIDGHIDSAATGQGAFFQLADLHIADRVYRGFDQQRQAGPGRKG